MVSLRPRRGLLALCALFALGAPMIAGPLAAGAQDGTPEASGPPPLPAGCTVVAKELYNPRDIAIDTDGTLYIAEAGDAGENVFYPPSAPGTPEATEPLSSYGPTGRISKVAPDGTQSVLTANLPSYTFGTEVVGPSGIAVANGKIYASIGGPGPVTTIVPALPNRDSVISINPATGAVTTVAHIGAYERSHNPDPNAIDSNLSGLAVGADGIIYAADAGGNTIYKIDPTTMALSVFAVIPGLPTPDGSANPARGGAAEVDPVPTDIAITPDGDLYVSLLTGAILWGTPGSAKVLHIAQDGTITDAVTGLNLAVSVAVGGDGTIYTSQISENFFASPPAPGVVSVATEGGTPTVAIGGLFLAYGVAVGPDGAIYVVVGTTAPMGTPPSGMVLRCEAGTPMATPETASSGSAAALAIELKDIAFSTKELTATAGTDTVLTVTNTGIAPHDWNIDGLNLHTGVLAAGASTTLTINAAAGTYTYYCDIPGHRQAGMAGTLTIQ